MLSSISQCLHDWGQKEVSCDCTFFSKFHFLLHTSNCYGQVTGFYMHVTTPKLKVSVTGQSFDYKLWKCSCSSGKCSLNVLMEAVGKRTKQNKFFARNYEHFFVSSDLWTWLALSSLVVSRTCLRISRCTTGSSLAAWETSPSTASPLTWLVSLPIMALCQVRAATTPKVNTERSLAQLCWWHGLGCWGGWHCEEPQEGEGDTGFWNDLVPLLALLGQGLQVLYGIVLPLSPARPHLFEQGAVHTCAREAYNSPWHRAHFQDS